jgi:1-pyrroline-5-carboxylate dehydrogenase
MNALVSQPLVTHTSTSGNLEPLHRELEKTLREMEKRLGVRVPNRIDGSADVAGEPYVVSSPGDARIRLGEFIEASPAAVEGAIAAARKAYSAWSGLHWSERVRLMWKVREEMERRKVELAAALVFEVGKPRLDALAEIGEALGMFDVYCKQMEQRNGFAGRVLAAGEREHAQTIFRPFGVFAVIAPFNYPVALPTNMTLASLLTGNTVVLKPSPGAALTGSLVTSIFESAGLPSGVVNMVCGYRSGEHLASSLGVDGFAFVGSHAVGLSIIRKAAAGPYPRPVICEMGGKNPAYVSRSADLDSAARGVAKSAFGGAGQKCTCCSVAFVHRDIYEEFLETLRARASDYRPGNSILERDTAAGPLINDAALKRYFSVIADARARGRIVVGGEQLADRNLAQGWFVAPTIVDKLASNDPLVQTELFCPLVSLEPFDDLGEAIELGNSVIYGLSAGFYGSDEKERDLFLERAQAGILYVNRPHGATTGGWPGVQTLTGWKGSGSTGKGALGEYFIEQYMRQQCRTLREP